MTDKQEKLIAECLGKTLALEDHLTAKRIAQRMAYFLPLAPYGKTDCDDFVTMVMEARDRYNHS